MIIQKALHLRTAVDSRRVQASAFTYECVGYSTRNRCVLLRFERSDSDKLYMSINTDFRMRASHVHMFVSALYINTAKANCLMDIKYMRSSMDCTRSEKVCHCMPLCWAACRDLCIDLFCRSLYAKKRCLEHDTPRNNLPFSGVQCRIVERTNVGMLRVSEIHLK
jgi:hypothetical protein